VETSKELLVKSNDELKQRLVKAEERVEEARREAARIAEENARVKENELVKKVEELTRQAEIANKQAEEAREHAKSLEISYHLQQHAELSNNAANENKEAILLEYQRKADLKAKQAEEFERQAREQAKVAEEQFLKVKKEREELAMAHAAIEQRVKKTYIYVHISFFANSILLLLLLKKKKKSYWVCRSAFTVCTTYVPRIYI
jgi:hypothetical protein